MKSRFLKLLNRSVNLKKDTVTTATVLLSLVVGVAFVVASDGSSIGYGVTSQLVGPNSVCKKVTNSSGTGLGVYIPTTSTAEWQSFYTNLPTGITAAICTCSLPWGGVINDGSSVTAYQTASPLDTACVSQSRTCTDGTLSGTYTNQSCTARCSLPWGGTINAGQSRTAYQASSVPYGSTCTSQTRTCSAAGVLSGSYQYSSCTVQACTSKSCGCTGKSCTSDARLKTHITPLSDARGMDAVSNLKPVLFRWKDAQQDALEGPQIGFIAQDLEKVFPEVVNTHDGTIEVVLEDGSTETVANPKTVQYANLVAPLVKAVQQLNAENILLKKRLEVLEAKVERIQKAVGN